MILSNARLAASLLATVMLAAVPAMAAQPPAAQTQEDKAAAPQPKAAKPDTAKPDAAKPDAAKPEDKAATTGQAGDAATGKSETAPDRNMVRVNIGAVRDSLATQLGVAAPTIPEFVLAPPGVAAEACSVAANSLEADLKPDGEARCTAITTSQALRMVVQKNLNG